MEDVELIDRLKKLTSAGVKLRDIEKVANYPRNNLSAIIGGRKKLAEKRKPYLIDALLSIEGSLPVLNKGGNLLGLQKFIDKYYTEIPIKEEIKVLDPNKETILLLKEVVAEKCPPSRSGTAYGRTSWEMDQRKRIESLVNKLI